MSGAEPSDNPAIFGLIERLADNKYFLGRRYAEWCSSTPTLESSVAAAAMAQDELGHARALYPLLKTLAPAGGAEIEPETRPTDMALPFLRESFDGWPDFVAANFLIDPAITLIFAAGQHSSYEPLAGRARKVLQEEQLHTTHGMGWVRRLAREGGAVRAALEDALRRVWDQTLCWLGPEEGQPDPLSAHGVLDASPALLRERFLQEVGPVIVAEGLSLPIERIADGYALTAPLPWDRWNAETYCVEPVGAPLPTSRS